MLQAQRSNALQFCIFEHQSTANLSSILLNFKHFSDFSTVFLFLSKEKLIESVFSKQNFNQIFSVLDKPPDPIKYHVLQGVYRNLNSAKSISCDLGTQFCSPVSSQEEVKFLLNLVNLYTIAKPFS